MHRSYNSPMVNSDVVELKTKMLHMDKQAALTLTAIYLNDEKPMSQGTIMAIKHNMKEIRNTVASVMLD